jgi:transglutaminase-like putative cysteine protease
MSVLRQYRIASFALLLVSIIAFATATVDFTLLFTAVLLATASWYVTEGPRGRTLPAWASTVLVVGLFGWSALDFVMRGELADSTASLGRFLLWLLVIKLYSPRSASEDRQRHSIATLLVVAGCLESVHFAFGVLVVLYAALAVWTAMLWRIHRSAEDARAARAALEGFAPALEIAVGRRTTPQFRSLAIWSVAATFVVSALVFILFPRLPQFSEFRGLRGGRSASGFSDEIRLGLNDRISESRRELFVVRHRDADGRPIPPSRPLLLRGAVLDRYDPEGERWSPSRSPAPVYSLRTPSEARFAGLGRMPGDAGPGLTYTVEFEMRALASPVLFAPYAPIAVATSEQRSIAIDSTTLLLRDVSSDRGGRVWSYALRVQPQPSAETLEWLTGGVSTRTARLVDIPVEGVRPVAEAILAEVRRANAPPEPRADATPEERFIYARETARAIASWMQANFDYTTDLSSFVRKEGEDPILVFLTRHRKGHCEFFASGLCAVLRALDIESRIVTGYIAMEYDENAGHYIVRESNAHAWVEVRSGERAWTAVDATPEDGLLEMQEQNRSFADNFRWLYGTLEFLWNSRVVSYDATAQAAIAERVQSGWRVSVGEWVDAVRDWVDAVLARLRIGEASGLGLVVSILTALAALAIAVTAAIQRARRRRAALRLDGLSAAARRELLKRCRFYAEAIELVERAGYRKPPHRTPAAFAASLAEAAPELGAAFRPIAAGFYRIRFGDQDLAPEERSAVSSALNELRAVVARNSRRR